MPTPMNIDDAIIRYVRHLSDDLRRSVSTVNGYSDELRQFARRGVPLEPEPLAAFITRKPDGSLLAPTTRNRRLAIIRGFARYLVTRGELTADPTVEIRRARVPRRTRVALTTDDMTALVHALLQQSASWRRVRDGTIFFYTGLRRPGAAQAEPAMPMLVRGGSPRRGAPSAVRQGGVPAGTATARLRAVAGEAPSRVSL